MVCIPKSTRTRETADRRFAVSRRSRKRRFSGVRSGFRYYNPGLGRWVSRDPIGEEGGEGLYVFAGSDPIGNIDARGRFVITLPGLAALAAAMSAKDALIAAATAAGLWVACYCHWEVTYHDRDTHYWWRVKTWWPYTRKRCYFKHWQLRIWCGTTNLVRRQFPHGPCYKYPRGGDWTIH